MGLPDVMVRRLGGALVLAPTVVVVALACSCGPRVPAFEVELAGSLTRDEIVEKHNGGYFIGMSEQELTNLCGPSAGSDSFWQYKVILGDCSQYAPATDRLLVRIEDGVVVETNISCD